MTDNRELPADAARDVQRDVLDTIRNEIESISDLVHDERRIATPQNQAVWIVRALTAAGFEIVQRGDGVRVPLELAKQIRHSWTIFQPGFILHDQFSELVDAAIAAGADPVTPLDSEDSATPAKGT